MARLGNCIHCGEGADSGRWIRTGSKTWDGYFEPFHSMQCSQGRTDALIADRKPLPGTW